jgi:hypothetical protein
MRFRSVGYTARLPTMDYGANGLRSRRILREATRRGKTPRTTASSIINLGVPLDLSKHLPGHCTPENCWISRLDKQEHRLTAFHQVRTVTTSTLAQVLTGKLVATGQNYTRGTSKKKKRGMETRGTALRMPCFSPTKQASGFIPSSVTALLFLVLTRATKSSALSVFFFGQKASGMTEWAFVQEDAGRFGVARQRHL